ncbi:hypothetical protein FOCC_FOCC005857 [Frankliniella occidentalis]|uniref:Uncharacterized protein LOC113215652 n=1 Tax=Frankliniella occidentalis TaxID=133901 RepID=A0A9C6U747_FRAOC|nr:uncharacterized protein LOC113215652 [Frankliniella occidentalis]KAE8747390.1 hypothetical protein FOCC_FOCC005857 [Frankliniella occidentalis]
MCPPGGLPAALLAGLALLCTAVAVATQDAGITVEGMVDAGGVRRRYSCPARFIRMGNSCYFMSTLMASWHDAHFKCRSMGAQLAAFEKRWENRNMRKYLMREELTPLSRWIGGIYQWEKRFWMWGSTGLAVGYKAFPRRMVTRDWTWHCISLDPTADYQWRPASCLDAKHYICETPLRRNRTRGPGKQNKGQQREPGQDDLDKKGHAGRHNPPQHRDRDSANVTAVTASGRRLDATITRKPATFSRNRTAHRRTYGGQRHGHRGYRPPPPPPAPGHQGRPAAWPGTGPGAAGAASHHFPHRLAYNAYDVVPARAPDRARGPSQGAPRLSTSARISFRTEPRGQQPPGQPPPLVIPDMTVQSLYPPRQKARAENNDFSNDV